MAKSRARYLAELLNSEGLVQTSLSALAGADGIIDLEVLPTIPNSQLEHSSVSIAGHSLSLGGSLSLDTEDIGEHVSYLYFTNARARAALSVSGSLSYDSATGIISYTTPTTISSLSNHTTDGLTEGSTNLYYTSARANTDFDTRLATKSTTDLSEGTNLYYTSARFDTAFSGKSTTDLSEGTNLYFTNARARGAISVSGAGSYDSGTGVITITGGVTSVNTQTGAVTLTTDNIAEGSTNLYYTSARANTDFDTRLATKSTTNLSEGTNLYYTDARVGSYLTSNSYATQSYVGTQIANLVDSAPATLDTLNELAAALGDDPNFATTVTNSIGTKWTQDNTKISNWDTAYGWGNHASAGYLTGNQTITLTGDVSGSGTTSIAVTVANDSHSHTKLSGFANQTEYDLIRAGNTNGLYFKARWDSATANRYWDMGYVDGYGTFYTGLKVTNGGALYYQNNTVWHAGNDGSGSGLDADLLDGQHGSYYYSSGNPPPYPSDADTVDGLHAASFLRSDAADEASPAALYIFNKPSPSGYQTAMRVGSYGGGLYLTSDNAIIGKGAYYNSGWIATSATGSAIDFATAAPKIFYHTGATPGSAVSMSASTDIWHAGNDGSGSGLDADLLDGNQSSFFADKTNNQAFAGSLALGTSASDTSNLKLDVQGNMAIRGANGLYFGVSTNNINSWTTRLLASGSTQYINAQTLIMNNDGYGNTFSHVFNSSGLSILGNTAWHVGNDGSGSGLDADLLDGLQPSQLSVNRAAGLSDGGNIDSHPGSGQLLYTGQISSSVTGLFAASDNSNSIITVNRHPGDYNSQLGFSSNGRIYYRKFSNTSDYTTRGWDTVWTSSTDGSGSGLDADLLDGQHASAFAAVGHIHGRIYSESGTTSNYLALSSTNELELFNSSGVVQDLYLNHSGGATSLRGPASSYVWTSGNDGSGSGLDADLLDGMQPGTGNSNIAYTGSTGNLTLIDPENYSGEVRLGAAWDYGGIYASNALTLSTSSATIQTVFNSVVKHTFNSSGDISHTGKINSGGLIDADNRQVMAVAHWSASGTSTGAVIIELPGNASSNYSMPVIEITTYEYNGNAGTTYIISGHNWQQAGFWYNTRITVAGGPSKGVYLGYNSNTNRHCIQLGTAATGWEYGAVTVAVKHHPSYYDSAQNMGGAWNIFQTTNLSGINTGSGNEESVWHSRNDGSGSGLDADLLDGVHAAYLDHRTYTDSGNYLGGHYVGGGAEKPNSSALGAGKLKPIMLSGSNVGVSGSWNDVLWMSTYSGSDVKLSTAIISSKYDGTSVWVNKANYDSSTWGTSYLFWNSGNDGSGSGLDADLLDGQQGSYYQPASTAITTGNIGSQSVSSASNIDGISFRNGDFSNGIGPDYVQENGTGYINSVSLLGQTDGALYSQAYSTAWVHQIFGDYRTGNLAVRGRLNGTWQSWKTVWTSANDGSGSGLDADLLDGYDSGSYLNRAGTTYYQAQNWIDFQASNGAGLYWSANTGAGWHIHPTAVGNMRLRSGESTYCQVELNTTGTSRAFIYADSSNNAGWLNSSAGWRMRLPSSGSFIRYEGSTQYTMWDSGNDGSGSGLDADLVDGIQGTNIRQINSEYYGSVGTAGWYTIAEYGSGRAHGEFYVYDIDSSRHNYVKLDVSWSYGNGGIVCTGNGKHGVLTITHARLLYNTSDQTYGGCKLQIYCSNPSWTLRVRQMPSQMTGWGAFTQVTPTLADSVTSFALYGTAQNLGLNGGISTSGSTWYAASNLVWTAGNDGSGSGLDADLLDGQDGSYYFSSANYPDRTNFENVYNNLSTSTGSGGNADTVFLNSRSGSFDIWNGSNYPSGTTHIQGIQVRHSTGGHYGWQIAGQYNQNAIWKRQLTNSSFSSWAQIWTSATDGSGSGLDADLLDGVQASQFVRADSLTYMSTSGIGRTDHHLGHLVGSYNNVGANNAKSNPIYSIGTAYLPAAASTSNHYGLGYSHPDFWGAGKTIGWGIYTTDNGNVTFTAGYSGGAANIGVWSDGRVDARGFTTNNNPWSTANSAWMPNGITTPSVTSWLYGTVYLGNAPGNGSGSQADTSGINTVGFHKAYEFRGNGNVSGTGEATYHPAGIYSTGTNWLYGTMYMNGNSQYMSGGGMYSTNEIVCDTNYGRGLNGVYSSTRYQHVWMMGTAYQLAANGTGTGNAYGLSYTHTNVGTGTNQAIAGLSHQLQGREAGNLVWALGTGIWTAYNITAYSDRAVKTNLEIIPDALAKVCQLNGYTYDRTDYKPDPLTGEMPETRQAGVVAQEVELVLPEVVSGEEGNKAVAYGNMVALLIEAIKELKAETNDLKAEVNDLRAQLESK